MAWPIDVVTRVVTAQFLTGAGAPAKGRVTFTPTAQITTLDKTVVLREAISATLDTTGSMSVTLPTTDNTSLQPANWAYEVSTHLFGAAPRSFYISLLRGNGSPVNLNSASLLSARIATEYIVNSPGQQGSIGPQGVPGPPGHMGPTPVFTRQSLLTTFVGSTRFYFDTTAVISQVRASVGAPAVGSPIVVDILVNGASAGTITIPPGEYTAVLPLSQITHVDDYVTVNILSVGSTYAGSDLTVVLTIN